MDQSDEAAQLAYGARNKGAKLVENCAEAEILTDKGKMIGVRTVQGDVVCEKLALCSGQWT